ncbi:hypothetical protein [Alistipes sp.]|uniref:hypothetical protein n=1 Tax=Alistipes sp. TaxID=1872444 RepID=UPI0025C58931|nr:hypothetical protein [Alistipes sp.]MCI7140428.1 hypothetical protein [Alistipes sp.]MDY5397351.1 hypothetical protein [Alistipes sp.]
MKTFLSKKLQNPFEGTLYAFRENTKKVFPFYRPPAPEETGTDCGQFMAVEMCKTLFNICGLLTMPPERQPVAETQTGSFSPRLLIVR